MITRSWHFEDLVKAGHDPHDYQSWITTELPLLHEDHAAGLCELTLQFIAHTRTFELQAHYTQPELEMLRRLTL